MVMVYPLEGFESAITWDSSPRVKVTLLFWSSMAIQFISVVFTSIYPID